MRVDFYQLSGDPAPVLASIAARVTGVGGRLLVVADDDALLTTLDRGLWLHPADGFLPHGRAGEEDEARQPVLLSRTLDHANGASGVALADGVWRDAALTFERVFHLFGEDAVAAARTAWRGLSERPEVERRFWKQDDGGRWTQAG